MRPASTRGRLCALPILSICLLVAAMPAAALPGGTDGPAIVPSVPGWQAAQARTCRRRMGPYVTQRRAYEVRRQAIARGFQVSGVWGQGGVSGGTRVYFFNVFYPC